MNHEQSADDSRDCDPLNRLLDEAAWPEPSTESIERLRRQWRELTPSSARPAHPWPRAARIGALAAAVLAAIALTVWDASRRARDVPLAEAEHSEPALAKDLACGEEGNAAPAGSILHSAAPPPATALAASSVDAPASLAATPRAATAYEMLVFSAAQRRRALARRQPPSSLAASTVERVSPAERARRMAAQQRSVVLGQLAQQELDRQVQQVWLAALLARGDLPSLRVFLQRVGDPRTSQAALECAKTLPEIPVDRLAQLLASEDRDARRWAAQVLRSLDRPDVAQRLIAMVRQGTHRQEALLALLLSPEPLAKQFLVRAEHTLVLFGGVYSAKLQLKTLVQGRS